MILSMGRDCGDAVPVEKSKEPAGRPSLFRASRRYEMDREDFGRFSSAARVQIGRLEARALLGADALQHAEKIGTAIWADACVGEMNDGSVFTSWVGYEWVRADCTYGP